MGKKYMDTKEGTLESSILSVWAEAAKKVDETNKNDKSDDGKGLDAVQPKAVKKKFKDRKDRDIDNDGDVDDSDKFLHKRRKAVSKAVAKEGVEEFAVGEDIPAMEIGTDRYRDHALDVTPGETDAEWAQARDFKVQSMKEALAKVWGLEEHKGTSPHKHPHDEEDDKLKPVKGSKTMTGGKVAKVDTKPRLDEGTWRIGDSKKTGNFTAKNVKDAIAQAKKKGIKVDQEFSVYDKDKREFVYNKAMGKPYNEEVDLKEGKMKELHGYIEAGKSAEWIAKKMGVDVKTIKSLMSAYESNDGKYMEMLAAACNGGGGGGAPPEM